MSLKVKTAKNLGYVSFMYVFIRVVGIMSAIILMRILTPYDYGIVAIGMILITIFRNMETFGMNAAIIQKNEKDVNEIVLGTGFAIAIVMALTLFATSFLIAPYWAEIYHEPNAIWIMRFISLVFIVSSFGFVPDIQLRKKLDFKKYMIPNIGRVLTYSGSAIAFAILGFGYWSLIYGSFLGEITRILIFNKLSPWRIRFHFDKLIAKDLFSFGIWIVLSGLLYSTYSVVDNAIIGKILGVTMLGYYAVAYRWGHFTSSNIRPIFQTVMFPTFSKIKDNMAKLHKGYLNSLKYISLAVVPITVGWVFLGDKFILNVIGSKWENAILPLQILAISGLLRSLQVGATLFPALGKPRISTGIVAAQASILCALLYPFILWRGLTGASMAVVITFSITTGYVFMKISKLIKLPVRKALKEFVVPGMSSICMGIILFGLQHFDIHIGSPPLVELLSLFVIAVISYIAFLTIFTKGRIIGEIKEVISIIKSGGKEATIDANV